MNSVLLRLDIASAEEEIFSGTAQMVFLTGELGQLGITPGHAPLLTSLRAGTVRALLPDDKEEVFYVNGGMLEVQPYVVTVLADTAKRARDLDESEAIAAKERAEKMLQESSANIDFAKATAELAEALAQIRAIQQLKKHSK